MKAEKVNSDAAHIHGSYRCRNYGVAPLDFAKRESNRYRRASSPSVVSSSSSSRQRPSTALVVKMEKDDTEPSQLP
jgi:hypothetical protein